MNKGLAGKQRGGFVLGLIIGLLLGLAVALGVALYITKVPIPFINKVPQRTAEQDLEEAAHNKNWNPNAALAGKAGKAASGAVSVAASSPEPVEPAPAPTTVLKPVEKQAEKPVEKPADKKPENRAAAASSASAMAAAVADPYVYFVQAGAFMKADDAEQQRAKLAILGFAAKVTEREQSGRTVFRVRLGPMDGREEAEALQRKIESSGNEANLVPVRR